MLGDDREQRLSYMDFCCNEGQGAGIFNLVRNSRLFLGKISEHKKTAASRQDLGRIADDAPP
jgi:hypothetical protein